MVEETAGTPQKELSGNRKNLFPKLSRWQWLVLAMVIIFGLMAARALFQFLGFWPFSQDRGSSSPYLQYEDGGGLFGWIPLAIVYSILFFIIGIGISQYAINKGTEATDMPNETPEDKRKRARRERHAELARDLSIAFMVGAIICVIVDVTLHEHERTEHQRRQKAIEKDVFKYLLGYGIDSGVMEEVHAGAFASNLLREDLNVTYQFCCANEKQGFLRLRTSISYRLKNTSKDDVRYPLKHYFHSICPLPDQHDQFTDLTIAYLFDRSKKLPKADRVMIDTCIYKDEEEVTDDGVRRCVQVAKLVNPGNKEAGIQLTRYPDSSQQGIQVTEPIVIPGGQEVEVSYAHEQSKRFADVVTFITTHPAKNMTVKAFLCDPTVASLHLEADSAHRLDPVKVSLTDDKSRYCEWRIPKALLPGQGIELYWYPKESLPHAPSGKSANNGRE